MKKNLFYLFALICSMSLFTACSDDDEDTAWMVYQEPTEFADTKLQVITNGTEQTGFPVTFKATSATTGTLTFNKIVNVVNDFTMDVVLTKTVEGYDIVGEKEKNAGYLISVKGNIAADKIYLDVKTSGYASVSGGYTISGNKLSVTYNGATLVNGAMTQYGANFKATSNTEGVLVLESMIPGIYDEKNSGSRDLNVPIAITLENGVYSFTGELKNDPVYSASVVTVKGKIEAGKMNLEVTHKMTSPTVGDWKVKMATDQLAQVVFNFHTASGKTTFSENMMALVNSDPQMAQIIKKEMSDAELTGIIGNLLATYVPNLNGINLKETGEVILKFTVMGSPEPTELGGLLNYIIKDGKLSLVPNMDALLGMMMPTRAYNPGGILSGDGIPFKFAAQGNDLTLSVEKDVPLGLLGIAQALIIPMLGQVGVIDAATVEMINLICGEVLAILTPEGNTLEVGIVMTK